MKTTRALAITFMLARSRTVSAGGTLVIATLLLATSLRAQFVGETVLHSFHGAATLDGSSPHSGLVQDGDGVLYGTTWGSGSAAGGTVFRMNPDGTGYAILHNFTNAPDGGSPYSGLILGQDGLLYGTTYFGGISNAGTVFKLHPSGSGYEILRNFTTAPDAGYPWAGLVQGRDGGLYGTTLKGGDKDLGTVFRISTNGGGYQVLHSFVANFVDGYTPYAGLIQGHDGALYGTTDQGGSTLLGTVFRIKPDGSDFETLHAFAHGSGYWPRGAVLQGSDGMLYGTAYSGGPTNGGSVVYRVGTNGLDYTVLHAFPGGVDIWAGLFQASDGALYGTTSWGGNNNGGTVFRLRPDGSEYSVLHHFDRTGPDGSHPIAGLTGRGGTLYGTAQSGGVWGAGAVFRLTLAPMLTISRWSPGPRITITGFSNTPCRLDATTNCADWHPRASLVLTNGTVEFIETEVAGAPSRLYRAVVQ